MTNTMTADSKFWNQAAAAYAAKPVADPEAFERKIEVTRALLGPQDAVLEIGCGTGSLALRLAPFVGQLHGLDISAEMVRIARGKAEVAGTGNVAFHEGALDERFEALRPGEAGGVLAFSVLHLIPDRQAALQRIRSLLRPGGVFISSTVCLGSSWIPFGALISVMRWVGKAPWVETGLTQTALIEELEAAGFVDIERPDVGAGKVVGFIVARNPS